MASSSSNDIHGNLPVEELDTLLPVNNNALGFAKRALVGRLLFTGKQLNTNAVKETLYKEWSNYEELYILEKSPNMFLFCFKKEEHANEVMLKSPWYVMNHLMCLQYWLPEVSVTELNFDRNSFWVQIHNLPLENLNSLSASILLAKVGRVMEIEEPIIEGKLVRHFVRGRVEVDVTKALPAGCWIPRVNLPRLWVVYKYEKLQDLCFNCGILGHEQRGCEKPRVMASFNPNLPKYSHELSVQASESVDAIGREFERKKLRRIDAPQQHQKVIHFRSLDKPKEGDFCLEMSRLFTYDDVVERVAQQLGLEDPSKIRLTPHSCYSQQPKPQPIKYRGVDHLSDMLVHYNQTSDILYYEVLDIPLPELQGLKTLKVAFHHATKDEVVIHTITLPKQSTVGDVLVDLKTKVELSHPEAELRLLEVFSHKIYKVFPLNEKIDYINDQFWTLRAEEIPEEEKNLGSHDRLIHVYHFTKDTTQNQMQIQNFGEPFFLVIHECETLAEIKVRIQKKLQVPDDEFDKWKFAFFSLGRPEYLQDSDIVSSRFQRRDVYGAWEQYLGLEHTDNAPKRSYAANQNRHTYEKPVKIYN